MKQAPFLSIFIFFSSGILVTEYLSFPLLINVSFLLLFLLIFFFSEGNKKLKLDTKFKSSFLLISCFFLGSTIYATFEKENNAYSIEKNYLKGDLILGEISCKTESAGSYKKTEFDVKKLIRNQDTITVNDKIVLFLKEEQLILNEYDVCLVNTDLNKISSKNNPGEFDAEFFWKHKGIEYIGFAQESDFHCIGKSTPPWTHIFTDLRNYFSSILEKHLTGNELGIAKGLILGDRSSLDSEVTSKFGNTGAMHILAVSGLHVGILIQILTLFLGLFKKWISKNRAIIIALILVWIYSLLTGFSASVVRSVLMFTLLVGSNLWEKNYNNFNILAFSAVVILIWNPHFLFDIGFQLSYLAMLGIFMFYKPLGKVLYFKNKIVRLAFEGTMVGIAAQIMTVPFTLYYFHQFPNYFILTNLGLMIFSFLILVLGVSLFSVSFISFLAKPIAWVLSISLTVMLMIINFIDSLPGAVSSGFDLKFTMVILLFSVILIFYFAFQNQKLKWIYVSLFTSIILVLFITFSRFQHLENEQICFLQADEPSFIVKLKDRNFVFFANRNQEKKKAEFLAKSFQKIYPGKLEFFEISSKKTSELKFAGNHIKISHEKGGYEIEVNEHAYFYLTNLFNYSSTKTKIYAPWIDDSKAKFHLKDNSYQFFLN